MAAGGRKSSRTQPTARDKGRLAEYRRKRDFARTAEPAGGDVGRSDSGRLFVVQKHAARQLHYDLRLELDGVLKSWAVPKGPSLDPAQKPLAVLVEDHPLEYADFEGVIPAGEYGGGTVMLWDRGEWEPIGDAAKGLEQGDLKFHLHGEKLRGAWVLARMKGEPGEDGRNWLLIKKAGEHARPIASYNVLAELPFSIRSGRSMEQIAEAPEAVWSDGRARPTGAAPARLSAEDAPDPGALPSARRADLPAAPRPQLATLASRAPDGEGWLHEVKLDGYRLMCRLDGGRAQLLTRNGHDWTDRFSAIARAAARLPLDRAVLDGEVVVLDAEGISDFAALQSAFRGGRPRPFTYFVFDVLHAEGWDLRPCPLIERKGFLERVLDAAPSVAPTIRFCEHIVGHGPVVHDRAAAYGLEGIVCKQVDAPYVERRARTWLKVKCTDRQEFVVGGYTVPSGAREGFGALLLGAYEGDGLHYCGRVGTGFTTRALREIGAALDERRVEAPPFVDADRDPDARRASWVRPELVAEVEFTGWNADGVLRHPAFRGLREDKDASDVRVERPARRGGTADAGRREVVSARRSPDDATVGGVRISNPGRTVYPEARVTKRQVAEYYLAIAERILPHVAGRPLSLVRCPLGLAGESFFQRAVGEGFPPSIRGTPSGRPVEGEPFVVVDDLEGLLSLVQMGVLEIHTWGCREDQMERPDQLVFDLDPGPGILWEHVVASADFVRRYLENIGLQSFVKTTGGKGLHVVVPVVRRTGWDDAKAFTGAVARDLVRLAPRNFVATMAKSVREHRVFIDYLRNARGSTAVAPYSTRARPGACVSMPLAWEELSAGTPPESFTVRTVPRLVAAQAADPWAAFRSTRQSITKTMRRSAGLRS
jgi:bifunctional non-homologous end joining protein LigD